MPLEQRKRVHRSPKRGIAKVVKKKAPKPTEHIEVIDSEEDEVSPIFVPAPPRRSPTKNSTAKFQEADVDDADKMGAQEVVITAAERVKTKRRRLNAVKRGAAAARVPEFDEDSESDDEHKFEHKTVAARPGTMCTKTVKPTTSSNTNAGEGGYNDGLQKSDPRQALSETSTRTVPRQPSNANIVIGPFSGNGLDPRTLVGLHIEKTNIRGCALEKSYCYCLYPTLKLVEGAEEVHFTIDCERHDARCHGFEMDRKLSDALGEIVDERPVKIAEAVAGTCWRFAPRPVRKGYGEHIYTAVGLRLEGMDDIGWIWGRESKNGGTIFSYCDVNVVVSPRW